MPVKMLLFGKTGQVGTELQRTLPQLGQLKSCGREVADLEDQESLKAVIRDYRPDIIVNAAAYTAVDRAEAEPGKANRINAEAVSLLAEEAKRLDAWLVHYSTDYVFDGTNDQPYIETDQPNPLGIYGETKLKGEESIRRSGCKYLIFRTSWVYGAHGSNFIKTILRLAREREALNIVADQHGAPTSAALIAEISAKAIPAILSGAMHPGTYHLAASGDTTWHELARRIVSRAHQLGMPLLLKPEQVQPIPTIDYPTPATRPMNSRLDSSLLATTLGTTLPDWQSEVDCFIDNLVREEEQQ
ncbi:dTDP-4-dehydrorhamnose reductase [Sedimenticola hydrogenitrophicus]|uniref:dTDP-4-dehydrorhamnose reductase n=1 Tax=Sedimenticola hydrogenitrophicus TaxID=2967975 RepID=UPI0023AF481A|nr:dTDP-4-dehydrorhamnose reductase [Sedimenticola hydrogenitrophicus]